MSPVFRPATLADFAVFYDGGFPHTAKAWAAEIDGETVGIGGIAYRPLPAGPYLFSNIKPALERHPRAMIRAAKAFLAGQDQSCMAFADPARPGSVKFLAHLGFMPVGVQSRGAEAMRWPGRSA